MTQLKQPSIVRIFPKDGLLNFVLSLKRNYSLRRASSNNREAMCYNARRHFKEFIKRFLAEIKDVGMGDESTG